MPISALAFARTSRATLSVWLERDLINSLVPTTEMSSVWRIPPPPKREKLHGYHPTQKPLRPPSPVEASSARRTNLIFDPFTGSGTTGVAAEELGRFFVGAELEEEFCKIAASRIGAAVPGSLLRGISG